MADDMRVLAEVTQVTGLGMVMIRADLAVSGDAIAEAVGLAIPARTSMVTDGARSLGWMSPDELLLLLPVAEVAQTVLTLRDALTGEHAMIEDVSDMRCVFDVTGPAPEQVLAKLSPTDFDAMPADGLRRSRAGQVPSAFWRIPGGLRIVAFRSVTDYLRGVLEGAATPGSWLDPR